MCRKSWLLWEKEDKYWTIRRGHRWQYNTWTLHAVYISLQTHILVICLIYCFFTSTIVTRMWFNIMLYVHFRSLSPCKKYACLYWVTSPSTWLLICSILCGEYTEAKETFGHRVENRNSLWIRLRNSTWKFIACGDMSGKWLKGRIMLSAYNLNTGP
jgi:hypothetical protein